MASLGTFTLLAAFVISAYVAAAAIAGARRASPRLVDSAIGAFYDDFRQTTDGEVIALLAAAAPASGVERGQN